MTLPRPNTLTEAQSAAAPAALPSNLKRLVLTGFMGAGKSTVGRLLASRIGWYFLDLDTHLEQRAGASIPELFERHGEACFRQLESTVLASVLGLDHTILALGGGTPEYSTNRLLLEQTPGTLTVFLDAPFSTLYDRCVMQDITRPVLADPAEAQVRFERRHPLYRSLAGLTIETANLSPTETVDALLVRIAGIASPTQTPHFRS